MLPKGLEQYGVVPYTNADEALESVDAVMMLRIQKERIEEPLMASEREYFRHYGLTVKKTQSASSACDRYASRPYEPRCRNCRKSLMTLVQ